jgi:Gluconate 2-dehydrogenase subunit 3
VSELSRREFVRAGGSLGLLVLLPAERARALIAASAHGGHGHFLRKRELETLRALTARLVPGPPDDPDPGALEAHAAEAIDLLLGAFRVRPPLIHAGGPFSGRAGGRRDDFKRFVALDRQAALGWRIRLEGSRGKREREFAGPVRGLQQIYRSGLRHLDDRAQSAAGSDFAAASTTVQDAILADQSDDRVQELVGVAFANTLEAVYGPPEYGGNHHLVGWRYTDWRGDTQPRGFSAAEVGGPAASGKRLDAKTARAFERFLPALAPHPARHGAAPNGRRGLRSG